MTFPKFAKIKQKLQMEMIHDIPWKISEQFNQVNADEKIKPGMNIAITVGSRGIANIPLIVKSVVAEVKEKRGHSVYYSCDGKSRGRYS